MNSSVCITYSHTFDSFVFERHNFSPFEKWEGIGHLPQLPLNVYMCSFASYTNLENGDHKEIHAFLDFSYNYVFTFSMALKFLNELQ